MKSLKKYSASLTTTSVMVLFLGLIFILYAEQEGELKARADERKQLVIQTTIFEKTNDGKSPLKTFQIVLEKSGYKRYHERKDDKLGMRILYVWTKPVNFDFYDEKKGTKDVEVLVINVFAKDYIAKDTLFNVKYPLYKNYEKSPKAVKTIILNPFGYQHSVLDDVRILYLPDGEKLDRTFEIYVKIKQK